MLTGEKIVELRKKYNITQAGLANILFVSQQLVSAWENGSRRPDNYSLKKLADIFKVDIFDIYSPSEAIIEELNFITLENESISELEKHINTFLSLLSKKERYVFIRRYYYLDDYLSIAEKINIKDNQVRTIASRTRNKLKKYLEEATNE